MVVYHVAAAEWEKVRPDAFPLLAKTGKAPWRWVLGASAFGAAAGALSVVIFVAMGVEEGEEIKELLKLFPDAEEASLWLKVPVVVLAISAPAIAEELTFRGGILGFLLRLSGNNRLAVAGSIIAVSLVWSLIHIPNTDAPLMKCAQIFIIGIAFAEFARRSCIEAAIAGHLALNLAVAATAFAAFPDV